MDKLSNRLSSLPASETIAMSQRSRELREKGVDVIDLSLGEPDFSTPSHIKKAAQQAIEDNFTKYPPVPGIPELREAIARKLTDKNKLGYSANNVVVSTGGKQSLANVIYSLIDEGDEVIIPTPYWVSYPAMVQLAGGESVYVDAGIDQDFKITGNQLEAVITDKTKMVILNSPSNPTGSVYSFEELKDLADVLKKYPDVFIISDEIYEFIIYEGDHHSIAEFSEIKDRVILVNGMSKGFSMTGWRVGYIAGPEWIAKACARLQGQYTSGTNIISQKAAFAAITGSMDETKEMVKAFKKRRDLVLDMAGDIPGLKINKPQGAFYLFPDVSDVFGKSFNGNMIQNSADVSAYLLEEGHVATVSGSAFGNKNCIRLSYATSEDLLKKAMERIKDAFAKLK
ncbi:pyridoxal phosphate-dependent aminotransferase [Marinilabilia rubra]|uniref:Aminotransferase n=1 Tax=Marinilabilia rubra TaxID=2162893 RepID=A0A2U2BAX1_9BACT|nr:pyridoxal phosphate-dependent aminotransferase [Marinilabilia rubra]PWE00211.1 aspartate aminotransferase [Marinilabilia rubra]